MIAKYFAVCLTAIAVGVVLGFPVLKLCKKLKFSQTILHYVDKHAGKSGTPTMGGLIFIFASIIASAFFLRGDYFWSMLCLLVMLFYGVLGFLDDFIKIKFHQNEGLKPYQKIIGQVGIALVIAFYVYFKVGSTLDFFGLKLNLYWGIIPFIVFFFVAVTNSVNLLDGLDGLASGVSMIYLVFMGVILAFLGWGNLALVSFAVVGGLIAFILFNGFPAKIFMGDTGSLALGGFIASIAVFSGTELILPILGLMFVLTALSDIVQVLHYKRTKKRIFKMAPLHHHFEQLGVHENKIVTIYIVITFVLGMGCTLGYMFALGVI